MPPNPTAALLLGAPALAYLGASSPGVRATLPPAPRLRGSSYGPAFHSWAWPVTPWPTSPVITVLDGRARPGSGAFARAAPLGTARPHTPTAGFAPGQLQADTPTPRHPAGLSRWKIGNAGRSACPLLCSHTRLLLDRGSGHSTGRRWAHRPGTVVAQGLRTGPPSRTQHPRRPHMLPPCPPDILPADGLPSCAPRKAQVLPERGPPPRSAPGLPPFLRGVCGVRPAGWTSPGGWTPRPPGARAARPDEGLWERAPGSSLPGQPAPLLQPPPSPGGRRPRRRGREPGRRRAGRGGRTLPTQTARRASAPA